MLITALSLLAALQQPAPPPPSRPALPASPISRVEVRPASEAIQVGDSLRLTAVAYDSAGRELDDVVVRWFTSGGFFEGGVDSVTGVVTGGAAGTVNVTALVRLAGGGRPATGFARITVLPPPAARLALEPAVGTMYVGQSLVVAATPFAANGDRRYDQVVWTSDRPAVVAVSPSGRLTARAAGRARITATAGRASAAFAVTVRPNPVGSVQLEPATAAVRTGDVVRFRFLARTAAGRSVDDALPEWAVSRGDARIDPDGAFVAEQPGTYRVLALFAGKVAEAVVEVRPRDAVRPTRLVGRLPIKLPAAEFWLHPDGRHGYLSTVGDRVYAINLSDPSKPVITDSVVVDARTINDVMTTEDGKYGVLTREGASTRKNGIVILSFEDPAHPKPIAEFTETVSGGVHSTYVYRGYVYLTDDATGSMRVIDIRDPYHPKQVARWETPRSPAGRTLHDIDVRDGLAYLSYWNDGLVILDVGNGIKGGSPENPQLVSQYKYDLNALYRDVEAVGGPGFIRGTHTAWRHRNYVFVGDEVFSARPVPTTGTGVLGFGRAYGRLHVIDVSDIERPRAVAWYEPKDGGTHNVWVAGDTLYLGDYQGGLRVLDISGELRGDLLRQGREIAHVVTGDRQGLVPNAPNAWGAIYRDGHIYVPDMNSGLWIVKVEPKSELVP
ncbi:MAG TPA: Ig-like domain-containing protein [Gemmatimonadales bacterium]|nr:Ig-like domain-containing protein [Gemmatimonadales bacterium]